MQIDNNNVSIISVIMICSSFYLKELNKSKFIIVLTALIYNSYRYYLKRKFKKNILKMLKNNCKCDDSSDDEFYIDKYDMKMKRANYVYLLFVALFFGRVFYSKRE